MEGISPRLESMPSEILNMVFENIMTSDLSLEVSLQRDLNSLLNVCRRIRESAISWIPRRRRRLLARSWIESKQIGSNGLFSAILLQKVECIELDFSDLDGRELSDTGPHVQWLTDMWKEKNLLRTVSVVVRPDPHHLFKDHPRLVPDRSFVQALLPLCNLLGSSLVWEPHDFGGPMFPNGDSALAFAALVEKYGHVLKLMLGIYHKNPNSTRAAYGYNALHYAVVGSCLDNAKTLLSTKGLEVDVRDSLVGNTPLMNAVNKGDEEMVKFLLFEGQADSGLRNHYEETPLRIAKLKGHDSIFHLLRDGPEVLNGQVD